MEKFVMVNKPPKAKEYNELRATVGWRIINEDLAKIGLRHSLYAITFYHNDTLVAMGRVVGDMGIIFYLQDVIVHPDYQNKGLGNKVITNLLDYIKGFKFGEEGVMIGLMSACGKEEFYEKYGFVKRPADNYGHGMSLLLTSNS